MSQVIRFEWYEAVMVDGHGTKLSEHFYSKREAKQAIKEVGQKVEKNGFGKCEYYLMLVSFAKVVDDNGDVIYSTETKTKIE